MASRNPYTRDLKTTPLTTPLFQKQQSILFNETIVEKSPVYSNYERIYGENIVLGAGANGNVVKVRHKESGVIECVLKSYYIFLLLNVA